MYNCIIAFNWDINYYNFLNLLQKNTRDNIIALMAIYSFIL
jgi:hypothetical protein